MHELNRNEGTKVRNPRSYIYMYVDNVYTYTVMGWYGQMCEFTGKYMQRLSSESSSSLLPMLRGIVGSA